MKKLLLQGIISAIQTVRGCFSLRRAYFWLQSSAWVIGTISRSATVRFKLRPGLAEGMSTRHAACTAISTNTASVLSRRSLYFICHSRNVGNPSFKRGKIPDKAE